MDIERHGIILRPSRVGFDSDAVLNPGCILKDGIVHMLYRGVRGDNRSAIGYCRLDQNSVIYRDPEPVLAPLRAYEEHGVEDPRLLEFEGTYYLFYAAFDGDDACQCYATSTTLTSWQRHGIISPSYNCDDLHPLVSGDHTVNELSAIYGSNCITAHPHRFIWDKDGFIFPRRIKGKIVFVHRLLPSIQITFCNNLRELTVFNRWQDELEKFKTHTLLTPRAGPFESGYVGGGCPPIETEAGWLFIYHGVEYTATGHTYRAGAALLDREDPTRVLGRLREPLFEPQETWEKMGYVNDVVFPTGAVVDHDRLTIYYGASDTYIAACSLSLKELLQELLNPRNQP